MIAVHRLHILVGSHIIIYIVTECPVSANGKIPVFISKLGIESQIGCRQCAFVRGIFCFCRRDRAIRLHILPFDRFTSIIISLFCQIESIGTLTYHKYLNRLARTRNSSCLHKIGIRINNIQFGYFRIIPCIIHAHCPFPVFCMHRHCIDGKFHTFIIHLTDIGCNDGGIVGS